MFSGFTNGEKERFDTTLTPNEFELNMATRNTLLRQGAFFCHYTYKLITAKLYKQVGAGLGVYLSFPPFLFPAQKMRAYSAKSGSHSVISGLISQITSQDVIVSKYESRPMRILIGESYGRVTG